MSALAAPAAAGPAQAPRAEESDLPGVRIATLAFVGDVLLHDTLLVQGYEMRSSGGHRTLWRRIEPALAAADITYANLEGPVAEGMRCDGRIDPDPPAPTYLNATCTAAHRDGVYTQFPLHNYPPRLLDDLTLAGVDIVSTGNNHALDRGPSGVDATLDALEARGMLHFGTGRSTTAGPTHALTRLRQGGARLTLAWVACSFSDNGLSDPYHQLARCYDGAGAPAEGLLDQVRELAGRPSVDAVVVTPHWGHEYHEVPSPSQRSLAKELVAAGADVVVGSHPHVLQPLELVRAGNRQAYVMYSLGNFVADQVGTAARSTVVLFFDATREDGGGVAIANPRYLPLHMADARTSSSRLHALVPLDPAAELSQAEAESLALVLGLLPDDMRINLQTAVGNGRGRELLGPGSPRDPRGCCGQQANLQM